MRTFLSFLFVTLRLPAMFLVVFAAGLAFAQDPAAAPVPALIDPEQLAQLGAALGAGKYLLGLMVLVKLTVSLIRGPVLKLLPQEWKLTQFLSGTFGGWVLNAVVSLSVTLSAALVAGVPLNAATVISLLLTAILKSFSAAGAREAIKDVRPAQEAGLKAVADPGGTLSS